MSVSVWSSPYWSVRLSFFVLAFNTYDIVLSSTFLGGFRVKYYVNYLFESVRLKSRMQSHTTVLASSDSPVLCVKIAFDGWAFYRGSRAEASWSSLDLCDLLLQRHNVARECALNLRPGGYIFGILPEADRVILCTNRNVLHDRYQIPTTTVVYVSKKPRASLKQGLPLYLQSCGLSEVWFSFINDRKVAHFR